MLHQELATTRLKVRIRCKSGGALDERAISSSWVGVSSSSGIIQGGKNSRWATFFNQIADNLVVEIVDWCPLNLLAYVFLLLGFEGELDENLL